MNEPVENNLNKRKWRKKRKNFLSNAKKYVKKGQMGRGTKMSEDLYQYMVGILEVIKKGLENEEERHVLVNNVLDRTKGEELSVVGNQLGSRVIELLLPFATPEDLEHYMKVLSADLRRLCSDNFTSHVIEALLRVSCERATENCEQVKTEDEAPKKKKKKLKENVSKYSKEHIQTCYEFTMKICKYMLNNMEDFVWDTYANHILRSALKCLSGIILLPGEKPKTNMFQDTLIDTKKGIPPHTSHIDYKNVPDEFKELVKEFADRLSAWPQFQELAYQNITSALLQVLLYALNNVDRERTQTIIVKLLNEAFAPESWLSTGSDEKKDKIDVDAEDTKNDNDGDGKDRVPEEGSLPPVFESQPAVRLLEAALFVARKKTYTQLYARCFINRLARLACVPMLNFTVQRLIDNCAFKEEFEPMFDELATKMTDMMSSGNTGVLVALSKACLKLHARQAHFITHLESALNCSAAEDQKYFSVCCLRLLPLKSIDTNKLSEEYFIHIHGSVILQTLLGYQRPAKAVNGLLELSPEELVVVLCDPKGCHVTDALCAGQCVGVKARDKLLWRLKGYYQRLALSQHGSRSFEEVFRVASMEQKIKIMTEISEKSNLLNSTQYGKIIADKMAVDTFKQSQKMWEQHWKNREGKENTKEE